jgi:hypothetical protein
MNIILNIYIISFYSLIMWIAFKWYNQFNHNLNKMIINIFKKFYIARLVKKLFYLLKYDFFMFNVLLVNFIL